MWILNRTGSSINKLRLLSQAARATRHSDLFNALISIESHRPANIRHAILKTQDQMLSLEHCKMLNEHVLRKSNTDVFWSSFLRSAQELNLRQLTNCVADFLLIKPETHSSNTVVEFLIALAWLERFDDFRIIYTSLLERLTDTELSLLTTKLVHALCMTPDWEKAFNYQSLTPDSSTVHKCICEAALRFGTLERIFSLLDSWPSYQSAPWDEFYHGLLSRLPPTTDAYGYISKLLDAVQNHSWRLSENSANLLADWFNKQNPQLYIAEQKLQLSGATCPTCSTKLPTIVIKDSVVSDLSVKFYEYVLEANLYSLLDKTELESLNTFLNQQPEPFDCVIDYLNLAHVLRNPYDIGVTNQLFHDCIRTLNRRYNFRKFCFVGKVGRIIQDKRAWQRFMSLGNYTGISISSFAVNVKSHDDAFALYIALWSGSQCYMLSNDEFRLYRCLLPADSGSEFIRWQSARQISFERASPVNYIYPILCEAQGSRDAGWHIPYDIPTKRVSYTPLKYWLCIRPIQSTTVR